jgi:integrase
LLASSLPRAPPLPKPAGPVIRAADVPELRKAVAEAAPGTTILLADGIYGLDELLVTGNAYHRALEGIRATQRGEEPIEPRDPFLLRDVTTILIDCGLRPEECFRLKWEHVQDGAVHLPFGKTENARRTIPLTRRTAAILEMRRAVAEDVWVFPAPTRSGHVEKSSLKKQHPKACTLAKVAEFPLYTFRHTCLTRWAAHMDPYTLGYLAGHSDFSTTRRYVHPQVHTVREAIERARNGQSGPKPAPANDAAPAQEPAATGAETAQSG